VKRNGDIPAAGGAAGPRCFSGEAFDEAIRVHGARVFGYMRRLTGNDADAADATQETFIRAYRARARFREGAAAGPWLFAIARRAGLNIVRSRRRAVCGGDGRAETRDPAFIAADSEARCGLWKVVFDSLPERQATMLWLMYAEEMSVKEIARVMGASIIGVKVGLHRARVAMSAVLSARPEEDWMPPAVPRQPADPESAEGGVSC